MPTELKTFNLFVLGCQMNVADAERIKTVLNDSGLSETRNEDEADVLIAVACSVRQSAIDRVLSKGGRWKEQGRVRLLTGCVLPDDKSKMARYYDSFFDIKETARLPEILGIGAAADPEAIEAKVNNKIFDTTSQRARQAFLTDAAMDFGYLNIMPAYGSKSHAFVPIMTGCNHFCTYCAVPFTRGKELSRPSKDILTEIKHLIDNGYKEIMLLGQNVNNYGIDRTGKDISFERLLEEIVNIDGDFWLRFITSNPWNFNDKIIDVMAKNHPKIARFLHLPIQSGDNEVLRRMNRRHTVEHYWERVGKVMRSIPDLSISTDIIVGFPGETEEQFNNTAELMRKVRFDMAYIAKYSPRPGTAAAKIWKDDVPEEEKERRFRYLTDILRETAEVKNRDYLDRTERVLFDSVDEKKNQTSGRTETWKLTHIEGRHPELIGAFADVKITETAPWWLKGEVIG